MSHLCTALFLCWLPLEKHFYTQKAFEQREIDRRREREYMGKKKGETDEQRGEEEWIRLVFGVGLGL